ncbi:hypothetical protein [uncultured Anaerococcus sp.]|uniref:hypothetical protein n=1 Tax=uncultured Anaerococcus sp. TaxID=293428 RepID=UPI0028042DFD|nr:hypothetical protein [uncultured Anaerococcus sp.]
MILLTSCKKDRPYQKQDIEIRQRTYREEERDLSPELTYIVNEDSNLYKDKDRKDIVDSLDKGSIVKMIDPTDEKFALIDFNGNISYIEKSKLSDF